MDAAGWSISYASKAAYAYLKGIADIDAAHYPERLGQMIIVNAPAALAIGWKVLFWTIFTSVWSKLTTFLTSNWNMLSICVLLQVVRGWLDERTKEKIQILKASESVAALKEIIDVDQLPTNYEGKVKLHK